MRHGKPSTPHLAIDLVAAEKIIERAGATGKRVTEAAALGLEPSVWSRLRSGARSVTATHVAAVLHARQDLKFYDLFRVER